MSMFLAVNRDKCPMRSNKPKNTTASGPLAKAAFVPYALPDRQRFHKVSACAVQIAA